MIATQEYQWQQDCLEFYPRVLTGSRAHYCADFDYLPVDETCSEFEYCTCVLEKKEEHMDTLFKFYWNLGRMGVVEGLFVATQAELDSAYGSELNFGSVLGKHGQVCDVFAPSDITVVTTNQEFIKQFVTLIGEHGYNPLMFRVGVDLEEEPE